MAWGIGNVGGSGGSYGMIIVNYIEGSTVTISPASMKKDASSTQRIYYVKEAGTYSLTSTLGAQYTSTTVSITYMGQSVEVTLSYLVPSEYQAVEYLQGTGSQRIILPASDDDFTINKNFKVEVTGMTTDLSTTDVMLASGNVPAGGVGYRWQLRWHKSTGYQLFIGSESGDITRTFEHGNYSSGFVTLSFEQTSSDTQVGTLSYEGVYDSTSANRPVLTGRALFLFSFRGYSGAWTTSNCRIHRVKTYSGETLTRDLVSCYRKYDSVAGMYDRVTGRFYTNVGSGTFGVGGNL